MADETSSEAIADAIRNALAAGTMRDIALPPTVRQQLYEAARDERSLRDFCLRLALKGHTEHPAEDVVARARTFLAYLVGPSDA